MISLVLSVLLTTAAYADDLLNVLDDDQKKSDGLSLESKEQIFKSLIARPTAEQNIFFQFLQNGENGKALFQWPSAFGDSNYIETDNGRALYGYLLFKNGMMLSGLESLFQANPQKIDKKLLELWRGNMQTSENLWTLADLEWAPQWTEIFGLPAEINVVARRFDKDNTIPMLEELLRKTSSNTWERSWTEWSYITALLAKGDDIKAAKLLKHLQGVQQNNPVSANLMNLTAARMLYQNGFLNQAIQYYEKVEKASDYWFEAMEEMGWSEVRLGQPQNTLAYTQTLLVPSLEADIGPEVFYLASLANLKVCDYQEVSNLLKEFRTRFQAKAKKLLALKENPESPAVAKLMQLLAQGRTSMPALGGLGRDLPRHSTRDENLYYLVQRQTKLKEEGDTAGKLYSQSLSEGSAQVGFQAKMDKFRQAMTARSRNAYTASLNRIKFLADQELAEIATILKSMQIVEAELIQQLALADRVIADTQSAPKNVKKGTTGSQGRDTLSFTFQGEVWFDELANYKIDIAKGCQAEKGKTL